ncbi:MAG: serine hydrolase domain-containing protein, partial [Cyclobacteriaceae bacterium]
IKLIGEPGQLYSYQNVAYSLIDPVMQAATGKSYAAQMQLHVFEPLQMKDASLSYDEMINHPNIALPHEQSTPTEITTTYYNVAPAGGVNASISDMAQWLTALNGRRPEIISKTTLGQLFRPLTKTPVKNRYFGKWAQIKKAYYGLGFRILDYNNDLVAYHGGYVNGYRCEVAVYPKTGLGICVMANAATELSNQSVPAFLNLYQQHSKAIEYWEAQIRARQKLSLQK